MSEIDKNIGRQIIVEMTKPKLITFPIISWVIRFFQWKWWKKQSWHDVPSHVRIRIYSRKRGIWWIYEASKSMLKFIGAEYIESVTTVVRRYERYVSPEVYEKMILRMNKDAGKPYAKLQLLGMIFVTPFKLFGLRLSNPFADEDSMQVCAEAVYWVFREDPDFRDALSGYKPDTIDLCDIMEILDSLEEKKYEHS